MTLLLLLRTNAYGTPYASYWSDMFPRASRGKNSHWNFHFPDTPGTTVPGTSPKGAATFVLESDAKVTYAWRTGLFKSYSGKERRSGLIDDPAMRFEGRALLVGDNLRAVRSRIAQYAAKGRPFQLGLPYEELTLRAASTGTVVAVHSTAKADWAVAGQRVVVRRFDGSAYQHIEAVIQSVTGTTITIDETLGPVGELGASIMPLIAVFLEPQQGFQRYVTPDGVEHWNIRARSAVAGFTSVDVTAQLALAGTAAGVVFYAPTAGTAGNSLQIQFVGDAVSIDSVDTSTPNLLVYHFIPGVTTVLQMCARIERTDFVMVTPFNPADRSTSALVGGDAFAATNLSGGADATPCTWGLTATLTTFMDTPVWDRGVQVEGTADDSVHTMAEVQDLGGLPFAAQSADVPDWGRRVAISRALLGEWQWAKKFLDTVKGRWKSFWLPTYRPDLVATAKAAGTLTVESGESDVGAWYPLQRQTLAVRYSNQTWVYLQITDAVDNHDGTTTLDVADEDGVAVTLASVPELVCWLERTRLESDEVAVGFADARFNLSAVGRAVMQDDEDAAADTFLRDEGSVEESSPREGIEISHGSTTHRIATGTRDVTIDGELFQASPAGRGEIRITDVNDSHDEVQIHIPASHAFCQRWLAGFTPPQLATVTVYRQQTLGTNFVTEFVGAVLSLQPQGHTCVVRVISTFARALLQRLPSLTVARTCPHMLGDDNCGVDLDAIKVTTTVSSYNGKSITVASMGGNGNAWAEGGKVVHTSSGEAYSVFSQTGSVLELQFPIYGLAIGDAVQIYPGCTKLVAYCLSEFDNVLNFGNPPLLPVTNPMRATGFGVIRS